jgi:hypothetical protein
MKDTPILFSTPMVQAILEGRKTMTRRVVNPQPPHWTWNLYPSDKLQTKLRDGKYVNCPYGKPGDLLWVRESWRFAGGGFDGKPDTSVMSPNDFIYKADEDWNGPWKPSIHMPKSAARIWLEVTDVRVERLQEITETDAIAEGVRLEDSKKWFKHTHVFEELWQSINGPDSWEANPWVWVVSFKGLSTTGRPKMFSPSPQADQQKSQEEQDS